MSKNRFRFHSFGLSVGFSTALLLSSLLVLGACTGHDYSQEDQKAHEAMIEKMAEAERAEASLAANAEKSVKETSKRRPASVRSSVYVVQVGAFKVKENAEKLQAKLKESGFPVEMRSVEHSKNGLLHLVRLAPTVNKAEAETMYDELKSKDAEMSAQILRMPASL